MKRWLNVLWLFIGLICLLGGVTWSVIAQTPAYPFNPPTFAGSNAPGNCANGSLFFNIVSYLWQSCGPNNTWANLNSSLLPVSNFTGSVNQVTDVLCAKGSDTITGITCNNSSDGTTETSFKTNVTIAAGTFVQAKNVPVRLVLGYISSGTSATLTLNVKLGGTPNAQNPGGTNIYQTVANSNSANTVAGLNLNVVSLTPPATNASLVASSSYGNSLGTGARNMLLSTTTLSITTNTNVDQVLVVSATFGANTAGNAIWLYGIVP